MAKSYVENGFLYDAEDVIRNMQRDSIHWSARKEWDYTYADYYVHTGEYEKAIPHLRNVIKHEMRRKQRAREWFLMGQMQAALGNNVEATKAFKHVVKLNPPYELEFNARIAMTEVMSAGQSKKMIGRLKRMARSDKNKDYLDQVYYAIGNIYLAQNDSTQAIIAYERGAAKATRSGIEKGVLLLKLGDIYWDKERYNDAQRCYGQAIGMLDKERKDYEELSNRSKILDDLVPYTDAIHLQDSLQSLAKMSESERNAAIDRTIEALKKKEKEERRLQAEQNAQNQQNGGNDMAQNNQFGNNTAMQNQQYIYLFLFLPLKNRLKFLEHKCKNFDALIHILQTLHFLDQELKKKLFFVLDKLDWFENQQYYIDFQLNHLFLIDKLHKVQFQNRNQQVLVAHEATSYILLMQ